jgi:tetratricopeptide (TPR) repeat protein
MIQDAIRTSLAEAVEAMRAGRLDDALRVLERGGGAALKTAVGQNIRGDIFLKRGQHQDALKAFDAAIKLAPSAPEAYCNRGVVLELMGRLDEALAAHDRALRYRQDYATAHFNRGNVLKALGRADDAIAAYGRALAARAAYPEALVNRGSTLLAEGKALDALGDFGRAIALRPQMIAAHLGKASAHCDLAQYDQAVVATTTALKIDPASREALRVRYAVMLAADWAGEALAEVDAYLARAPEDAAAHRDRARCLLKLNQPALALDAADEALRLAPDDSDGFVVRGEALNELGRLEESLGAFEKARALGAQGHEFPAARAVARMVIGDPKEALADFAAALAIKPDDPEAHYNRAFLWLALGNWEEGWPEHEWRLRVPRYAPPAEVRHISPWEGEPLDGKRLLVYAEQGHGDALQFARYLRLIDGSKTEVTLLVPGATRRLFADNFPDVDVTDTLALRGNHDYRASLMSMPAIFRTTLATVPATVPYLAADPVRSDKWAERIGTDGFRVGIVWQGSRGYARDRDRSVPLAAFAPLASVPGVRLISVQAMVGLEQLDALPAGMSVERLGEEIESNPDGFREMAAAMANLDLLVMSDTGPTHLAAALGRTVWLATSRYPDWRWMREREDTPWYPNMRLFRQKTAGDWDGVFARMATELTRIVAESANKTGPRPSPG